MKRTFTFSFLAALCIAANADKVYTLGMGGIPSVDEPALYGLNISPNGKYVCGAIEMGVGIFVADWRANDIKYEISLADEGGELRHIDNEGDAIGFEETAVIYSYNTGKVTKLKTPQGYRSVLGESLTNDGSIYLGNLTSQSFATKGAYSTDKGETWNLLPEPSKEDIGEFFAQFLDQGYAGKQISADGKIILGFIGSFAIPMIWERNDNGEYECDFFASRVMKVTDADRNDPSKPLLSLSAMYGLCLSNNGKYAALLGLYLDEDGNEKQIPVVYNTEDKTFTYYNEEQPIDEFNSGLWPNAIADNGMFIGTVGLPFFGSSGSFVMEPGETQAKAFTTVYPDFAAKYAESDGYGFNMPVSLSADGQYILAYTYYCEDYMDPHADAYYVTYVIDTLDNSKVNEISSGDSKAEIEAIYDLNGNRLQQMTKGINIIRMTDGTSRKVMIK